MKIKLNTSKYHIYTNLKLKKPSAFHEAVPFP